MPSAEDGGAERGRAAQLRLCVFLLVLLVLGSTLVPLYYGASLAHGRLFTGASRDTVDHGFYLSYMQQGANGAWKTINLYTVDLQQPIFIHPFYVTIGHLGGALGLSMPVMYHVARLIVGAVLMIAIWRFLRAQLNPFTAFLALAFVFLSAGLGWLTYPYGIKSVDVWFAESNTYRTMAIWPHITWALLLKAGAVLSLFLGIERNAVRYGVIAGVCCALLAFDHTFDLVGIAFTYGSYAICRLLVDRATGRKIDVRPWIVFFSICALVAGPFVAYMYSQATNTLLLKIRAQTFVEPVPSLVEILSGYGLLLPLALVPAWYQLRGLSAIQERVLVPVASRRTLLFLYLWAGSTLCAMVVLGSQWYARRLLLGAHIPIAILAAIGVVLLLRSISVSMPRSTAVLAGLLVLAAMSASQAYESRKEMAAYKRGVSLGCRFYLEQSEIQTYTDFGKRVGKDMIIQPIPELHDPSWDPTSPVHLEEIPDLTMLIYGPWLTQHQEAVGHPWETPGFGSKVEALILTTRGKSGALVLPLRR